MKKVAAVTIVLAAAAFAVQAQDKPCLLYTSDAADEL